MTEMCGILLKVIRRLAEYETRMINKYKKKQYNRIHTLAAVAISALESRMR